MILVKCLVRQFSKAFDTLLSVTFHVVYPSCDALRFILLGFDICSCADQLREQLSVFPSQICS